MTSLQVAEKSNGYMLLRDWPGLHKIKVFVVNSSFIETLKSKGMGSDGFPSSMC